MSTEPSPPLPEFMVRVKLPDPSRYSPGPSGDNAYDDAYDKALRDAVPPGFEVRRPRLGQRWPVDSEGYTFVPLYCSGPQKALSHYIEEVGRLEAYVSRIRKAVGQ